MDDRLDLDSAHDDGSATPAGEARLGELRAAVERGLEDIKAKRAGDVEEAFTRIEAMLD